MTVNFIMSYCFILLWHCDVWVENLSCQGASLSPPEQVSATVSLRTYEVRKRHSHKLNIFHVFKQTLFQATDFYESNYDIYELLILIMRVACSSESFSVI
jgi:hypothetical protein